MTSSTRIKQGDSVAIPWGVDEVVGTAIEVYGPPGHHYVLVRVPTQGPAGETLDESTVSYPEEALRRVSSL